MRKTLFGPILCDESFATRLCVDSGLEPFCQEPEVLKKFEAMASGKILLAEILERGPVPLVVLYDTSHDDDVNINAVCIKSLQDKTLASPLKVRDRLQTFYQTIQSCVLLTSSSIVVPGEQRLHEREHQQRLLGRHHLLPASLQRPGQAD